MSHLAPGVRAILKWDDAIDNQCIIGKTVTVVTTPQMWSPHWVDVEYEGNRYIVRGDDLRVIDE